MLSLHHAPLLSLKGDIRFDVVPADVAPARATKPPRAWSRQLRRDLGLRGAAHALLADERGVWAWEPENCYASASRHGGVREWMRSHPGVDVRLWVSAALTRDIDDMAALPNRDDAGMRSHARQAFVDRHGDIASTWPLATWRNDISRGVVALAGIDLDALRMQGAQSDVRIRSVEPWWHHAYLEAKRCVPRLGSAAHAHVCVVEGRAAAWIALSSGTLNHVRRCVLEEASVDALHAMITRLQADQDQFDVPTVVMGQGLVDGGDTGRMAAHVLGRLDGDQPPQWLRPCTRHEVH